MDETARETQFFLRFPNEVTTSLADNGIDLVAELRAQGLAIRPSATPDPTKAPDGSKDVTLAIIAAGVAAPLIAGAVGRILNAIGRNRKYLVFERELVPAVDAKGAQVLDASGHPVLYWSEKKRLIETADRGPDRAHTTLKVDSLLEFETQEN